MHPQIHADAPGDCPICHMHLVAVQPSAAQKPTATAVYTCLMHPQVREKQPGNCPICGMDLVKRSSRPASRQLPAADLTTNDLIFKAQQVELGNIQVQTFGAGPAPVGIR